MLALLAVFSFATAPAGFMPGFGTNGPVLLICPNSTDLGGYVHSADSDMAAKAHAEHHGASSDAAHHGTGSDAGSNSSCDYGTPAHADQPPAVTFEAPVLALQDVERPVPGVLTTIFPPKLPPATGPPSYS